MKLDPAIVEAAAKAIGQANEDNNWEGISFNDRDWYCELAMCALVKVTPLIRAQVLEEAAQNFERYETEVGSGVAAAIRAWKEQS